MKRKQWTTTFREDLRKDVNILAAELEVKPNHILEIAFEYLNSHIDDDKKGEEVLKYIHENILCKYKED